MQSSRRRKKRQSQGIRTLELVRGRNGFGFTISGQFPCILSCIVSGSPAEAAGLHPGDYLLGVNGHSVMKSLHDDVVRLIGSSTGFLKLQISDNYCSDTSDEELLPVSRIRPRCAPRNKTRQKFSNGTSPRQQEHPELPSRVDLVKDDFVVPDLPIRRIHKSARQDYRYVDDKSASGLPVSHSSPRMRVSPRKREKLNKSQFGRAPLEDNLQGLYSEQELSSINFRRGMAMPEALIQVVVGYLGTVEMPKDSHSGHTRNQAIKNCIRRLHVEKKVHTLVLMSVFGNKICLHNSQSERLAEYPASCIVFCGIYQDDRKLFGLVTQSHLDLEPSEDGQSSSCHVFMVDSKMVKHVDHVKRAEAFGITCMGVNSGDSIAECIQFPETADPILQVVMNLYRGRVSQGNEDVAPGLVDINANANASPQPSTTSTNSSNSDSGIGFRDESRPADRIYVLDVQSRHFSVQDIEYEYCSASMERRNRGENISGVESRPLSIYQKRHLGPPFLDLSANQYVDLVPYHQTSLNSSKRSNLNATRSLEDMRDNGSESERNYSVRISVGSSCWRHTEIGCRGSSNLVASCGRVLHGSESNISQYNSVPGDYGSLAAFSMSSSKKHNMGNDGEDMDSMSSSSQHFRSLRPELLGEGGASTWMHAGNAEHSKNDQDQSRKLSRTRTGEEDLSTLSDTEVTQFCDKEDLRHVETSSVGGSSANSENVGRVGSWALSFERLLDDTAGIHTFAEFLKKEFSHENIYFWAAVQRYKNHPLSVRGKLAQEIYDRHISVNASEPVNVDSQARQTVQERLRSASPTLFQKAEDQIFKLMKFDSYPRFLKSPLYKEALMAEVAGYSLPYPGGDILESDLQVFEADEVLATPNSSKHVGRRRSLLAWGRRARAKSRDRGRGSENHGPRASSLKRFRGRDRSRETNSSTASSTAANEAGSQSSKTSLTASDLGILSKNFSTSKESLQSDRGENSRLLCRVILPDQSTTVVSVVPGETVRSLVHRLLERRGLKYSAVDVFTLNSSMALDQLLDCASLACQDIRVEARVLIQVDLPSGGKSMSLKAAPGRRLAEVLRPVLANLGLKVDQLVAYKLGDKEPLSMKTLATNLDSQRVILKQKDGATGLGKAQGTQRPPGVMLDEITNKVFLDLMRSKSVTDADRVPTDESSSQSSGIVGSLVRRNSIHIDRDLQKNGIQSPIYEVPSPKPNFPSPTSETLYEDLKKAQKLRLEDQRGTTINCQLPEFLKSPGQSRSHNKENREIGQMMPGGMAPSYSRFSSLSASIMTVDDTLPYVDMSFSHDGILPTHAQAENYFGLNQAKHVIAQAFQGQHKSCSMSPFPPQDGDVSLSPLHIPTPNTSVSSLHVEEANFTPPSPLVVNPKPLFRNAPPPPLPPKPKTCPPRGPPPRPPPSRPTPQLNLYEINLNGSSFPQCQDLPTGNVSFV